MGALGTHAVPTINPSAAAPARVMMLVSLNPFPPMKGTVMPRFRAWISSRVPSRASALTTMAWGLAALALVSCAEKSLSPRAKVMVSATWIPFFCSSSANVR